MPAGIQAKGVNIAIESTNSTVDREAPAGMEEMKSLGEDIVINEPGVNCECTHEEYDVTATIDA